MGGPAGSYFFHCEPWKIPTRFLHRVSALQFGFVARMHRLVASLQDLIFSKG